MTTNIYALIDPRSNECRYIGKADRINRRLAEHFNCKRNATSYKTKWVNSLIKAGIKPEVVVLEVVPQAEWIQSEKWWIAYLKALGARLTNATIGGEGIVGYVRTEEHNRKLTAAKIGVKRSPETVKKMADGRRGLKLSPETCRKMSESRTGKPRSEETKRKISASHMGIKHSAESKIKMSASHTGVPLPESTRLKMSEAQRRRFGVLNACG